MNKQVLKIYSGFHLVKKFPQTFAPRILLKVYKGFKLKVQFSQFVVSFIPSLVLLKASSEEKKSTANVKLILEADRLYDKALFEDLYCVLNAHRTSSDPEVLWRLARAIFEKCRLIKDDKERLINLEEALQLIDKALEIRETCWAAHKWRAILLDYVWREKSTKGRIIHSFGIKKHMERAIELNPEDSTSYYLLGEWCFTFADMPWYERKVAGAIFASPPTSTYEEALQFFEKAEQISPLFYSMNLLMLGKCHLHMNNKEKGIVYLRKALDYPVKTADDQKAHEEAKKLLKSMNIL